MSLRNIFVLFALGFGAMACAQDIQDYSGTWELNTKKGENLGMVAAIQETLVVSQTETQLTIDFTDVFQGKTSTRQVNYDLAGKPMENFAAMGNRSETVSEWSGNKLITTWTSEGAIAGTEDVRIETRSLSEDGKTMTVATARGEHAPMVLVYEKQ